MKIKGMKMKIALIATGAINIRTNNINFGIFRRDAITAFLPGNPSVSITKHVEYIKAMNDVIIDNPITDRMLYK
jgi:hypothetical protein